MILIFFWVLRTIRAILWHASLWQVKEYRLDRIRAHLVLQSTRGRMTVPLQIWKWFLLALAVGTPRLVTSWSLEAALLVTYAGESLAFATELLHRSFRRPKMSVRAAALLGGSMFTVALLFFVMRETGLLSMTILLILDRFTFLIVAALVLASRPWAAWQREKAMARAARKRQEYPSLIAIGITGSYGKTSTKEFLTHLLSSSRRVVKTPAHVNTEIGIAQTILRDLQPEHDIFVCEMGAYRAGEITRSAMMVRPHIGILTAIHEQHQALFGSAEGLARAKGELLRALPPDGMAIINGDDPQCLAASGETPARTIIRYGLDPSHQVRAANISAERAQLRFQLFAQGKQATLALHLLGGHQVPSLLAAVAAASAVGIPFATLVERLHSIQPLPQTMEPRNVPSGALIIDDSYSANPDGVVAALEYVGSLDALARVVVLTPMIELGGAAREAHRRVGAALARARPSRTILTSPDFAADIRAGAGEEISRTIMVETTRARMVTLVQPFLTPENIILLEGRVPERLRTELFSLAP